MLTLSLILLTASGALADRDFVATAYDTEEFESGYSNTVQTVGWVYLTITFEWKPNVEPDIAGYKIHSKDPTGGAFVPVAVEITHIDYCIPAACRRTLSIEPITNIILQKEGP